MGHHYIQGERTDLKDAALDLFVGRCIGTGWSRHVYELIGQPDKVMKIEHSNRFFSNAMEWRVWDLLKDTEHAIWFAPCYQISFSGTALIQGRTEPFSEESFRAVVELPDFLDDVHWGNFGIFEGRVVCHDYGRNNLLLLGTKRSKMVKVKH